MIIACISLHFWLSAVITEFGNVAIYGCKKLSFIDRQLFFCYTLYVEANKLQV